MKGMGIEALYRKPGTSKKHSGHTIYPYLLRGLTIDRSNQVWVLDTTYIPMARGFVSLAAVVEWASRKVLAAKITITLEASVTRLTCCRRRSTAMEHRKSSTLTREASLPQPNSYRRLKIGDAERVWTVAGPGGTMFLLNDYGKQ